MSIKWATIYKGAKVKALEGSEVFFSSDAKFRTVLCREQKQCAFLKLCSISVFSVTLHIKTPCMYHMSMFRPKIKVFKGGEWHSSACNDDL